MRILRVHVYIFLFHVQAVRYEVDLDLLTPQAQCQCEELCPRSGQGRFRLPKPRRPEAHYVVETSNHHYDATVVAYVDPDHPLNESYMELYVDPALEVQLRAQGQRAHLCEAEICVCRLDVPDVGSSVERLASPLPASLQQPLISAHLAAERQCPGVSDRLSIFLLLLISLVLVIAVEALVALRMAPQGKANSWTWPDGQVKVESPMKTFAVGVGWSAGFITCLLSLQAVTLSYVEKTDVPEPVVWLVIVFPCFLAILGIFRLTKLLCKKQLFHHSLASGVVLVDPAPSVWADRLLILALALYSLLVSGCACRAGIKAVLVALVAQMGPAWTVLKALRTAQEQEEQLRQLVLNAKLCNQSFPKVTMVPWSAFLSSARSGNLSFSTTSSDTGDAKDDLNALDLRWHRTALRGASGFAVLPSAAALLAAFLVVAAVQGTRYACARGSLTDLRLVTELHGIDFRNHQENYVVHIDTSFNQVALEAACSPASTWWVSFQQPQTVMQMKEPVKHPVFENESIVGEEIQLSQALIPRAALVKVQGLRQSLAPTQHRVRFSPLRTLPFLVNVTAGDYHASIPWSTAPGSTVSLPPDVKKIDVTVTLVDFYLGIPISINQAPDYVSLWTVFNASEHANNKECKSECEANPNCLTSFHGVGGCYFAFNNHSRGAPTPMHQATSKQRRLAGRLDGCVEDCDTRDAQSHMLRFEQIEPDWRGVSAQLMMAVELDVGEQHFISEAGALELHRGRPLATDAIAKLIGTFKNGSQVVMRCNVKATQKDIVVVLEEYDPFEFDTLQLLVMPVVTDPAFGARWSEPVMERSEAALLNFSEAPSCRGSRWLRERYTACGAVHGLPDQPMSVNLSPWRGLEEPRSFTVVLREGSDSAWPAAATHHLQVLFNETDSPVGWAADRLGCDLLKMNVSEEVARSADALCALTTCSEICSVLDEALGVGQRRYWDAAKGTDVTEPKVPRLGAYASVQALACHAKAETCKAWHWVEEDPKLLRLKGTGTAMSPVELIGNIARLRPDLGRSFIQNFAIEEVNNKLLATLAGGAWDVPAPRADFLTSVAAWNKDMPQALLDALVEVGGEVPTPVPPELQHAFEEIAELGANLKDAGQIVHVAQALRLAPSITELILSCARCPEAAKAVPWKVLCPELPRLEGIDMRHFRMVKGIECAAEPMRATTLYLLDDEILDFPGLRVFDSVQELWLCENPLTSLQLPALLKLPLKELAVAHTRLPEELRQRIREELKEKKGVEVIGV